MIALIVLAAIAAACFILFELRKLRLEPRSVEAAIKELDLEAMSNLLDEIQMNFIRAHLSARAYRRYERGKNRVLLAYLDLMSTFLESRIRTLTAPSNDKPVDSMQLDLFVHARQLVLRAQVLLWISLVFPWGVQLSHSAYEYCRALADSLRSELVAAKANLVS